MMAITMQASAKRMLLDKWRARLREDTCALGSDFLLVERR